MTHTLRSFRMVPDREQAEKLIDELQRAGLHPVLHVNSAVFDVTFTAGKEQDLHVLLPASEFLAAEEVLEAQAIREAEELPADHYLRSFSEEELLEVVGKPDEWNAFDRVQARRLLAEKGRSLDETTVGLMREQRMDELSRPEKARGIWLAAGIAMVWVGGFGGMVIGWSLMAGQRTLPNGQSVPRYREQDRNAGRLIFIAGLVVSLGTIWLLLRAFF